MIATPKETALSRFLEPLFNNITQNGLPYCICGNYQQLPYATDNDIDIWTSAGEEIFRYIIDIFKKQNIKIYLRNTNATGCNIYSWTYTDIGIYIIHIDILSECRWYAILPLVKSKVIESNRELHNNFYVANRTVDAVMHLMYPLAHFGKVTPKYYDDLLKAAETDAFWEIVEDRWGPMFVKKIEPLVKGGSWSQLEKEFAQHKIKLAVFALAKVRTIEIKSFFVFILTNIKRLYKPSGLFIAFIGPDGCGKTTIQNNLTPFFEKGFTKGKIKKFYWRPFLLPRIKAFLHGGRKINFENPEAEEPTARLDLRKVGLGKSIAHCLKLFYYWFDYIFGRLKYQGAWSRGGVVCFDRYWDDLVVFPERFGINVPQWLVRLLGVFVPKPDIVFYLHAEAEVLVSRKPELPFEEMKYQIEQYKALCHAYNNFVLIDGDQSEGDVLDDVISTCLEKMSKRYPEN